MRLVCTCRCKTNACIILYLITLFFLCKIENSKAFLPQNIQQYLLLKTIPYTRETGSCRQHLGEHFLFSSHRWKMTPPPPPPQKKKDPGTSKIFLLLILAVFPSWASTVSLFWLPTYRTTCVHIQCCPNIQTRVKVNHFENPDITLGVQQAASMVKDQHPFKGQAKLQNKTFKFMLLMSSFHDTCKNSTMANYARKICHLTSLIKTGEFLMEPSSAASFTGNISTLTQLPHVRHVRYIQQQAQEKTGKSESRNSSTLFTIIHLQKFQTDASKQPDMGKPDWIPSLCNNCI